MKAGETRPAKSGTAKPASKAAPAAKTAAVKAAVSVGKKAESTGKHVAPVKAAKPAGKPVVRKPAPAAKAAAAPVAGKAAKANVVAKPAAKPAPAKPAPAKPAPAKLVPAKSAPAKPAKAAAPKTAPAKVVTGKAAPAKAASKPVAPEEPARAKTRPVSNDLSIKIIHMIAEEMAVEEAELTPSASFREDLNLDEIDVAELLVRAEELFSLKQEFDDEEWENCQTVGDFIALVERRVGETPRRGASAANGKKSAR